MRSDLRDLQDLGGLILSTEAEILRYFPSPPTPLPEGEGRKKIRENLYFSTYHPRCLTPKYLIVLNDLEKYLPVVGYYLANDNLVEFFGEPLAPIDNVIEVDPLVMPAH